MRFAVIVLIILAIVSVISMFLGEFYPVRAGGPGWQEMWQQKLGLSKPVFDILLFFQLHDPFRSWWFQILLSLLSLSLLACILARLPIVIRSLRTSEIRQSDAIMKMPLSRSFTVGNAPEQVLEKIPHGFNYAREQVEGETRLAGSFAAIAKIGPILAHTGLLCLALGGLFASWLGVSTRIAGLPGDVLTDPAFNFKARVDSFRIEYYPLGLGQYVLVDDAFIGKIIGKEKNNVFTLETEGSHGGAPQTMQVEGKRLRNHFDINMDRGNIKDYVSVVTIMENDREVLTTHVEVNHPLRYKNFRFYQTSFDPDNPRVTTSIDSVRLVAKSADGTAVIDTMTLTSQGSLRLPDGSEVAMADFLPDFRMSGGAPTSASAELRNPAVLFQVNRDDKELYHQWSFLKNPFMHTAPAATYSFQALEIFGARSSITYPTVLEVKKSPGTGIIWVGFILMTIGMFLAFYIIPQRVWLVIRGSGTGKSEVFIGGYCQKSHHAFTEKFERWVERMKG